MTHQEQVSVLSQMHLQQAEKVKAQNQEIWHVLALVEQQQEAIKKLASPRSSFSKPRAMTSCSESKLDIMQNVILNLILRMVNVRQGTAMASYSPNVTPVVNKALFEDMLTEEANLLHQASSQGM